MFSSTRVTIRGLTSMSATTMRRGGATAMVSARFKGTSFLKDSEAASRLMGRVFTVSMPASMVAAPFNTIWSGFRVTATTVNPGAAFPSSTATTPTVFEDIVSSRTINEGVNNVLRETPSGRPISDGRMGMVCVPACLPDKSSLQEMAVGSIVSRTEGMPETRSLTVCRGDSISSRSSDRLMKVAVVVISSSCFSVLAISTTVAAPISRGRISHRIHLPLSGFVGEGGCRHGGHADAMALTMARVCRVRATS